MQEQIKYAVPQIDSQTGVSNDYSNEITTLRVDFLGGDRDSIISKIKGG